MRSLACLILLTACSSSAVPSSPTPAPVQPPVAEAPPGRATAEPDRGGGTPERVTVDTPKTTVRGHAFIAPAGWRVSVRGQATILEAPEDGSRIALVDVQAKDAEAALAAAWAAYKPDAKWPLEVTNDEPDRELSSAHVLEMAR